MSDEAAAKAVPWFKTVHEAVVVAPAFRVTGVVAALCTTRSGDQAEEVTLIWILPTLLVSFSSVTCKSASAKNRI